jgi:hypothetical protein
MFARILYPALAASALLSAATALGDEPARDVDTQEVPLRCECVAMRMPGDRAAAPHAKGQQATSERERDREHERVPQKTAPRAEEDRLVRHPYWEAP